MTISVDDMARHAELICKRLSIFWFQKLNRGERAHARPFDREVIAPPVAGEVSYATVLHEIGHILGRHQGSRQTLIVERWAWRWARENALIWTKRMEGSSRRQLVGYGQRAFELWGLEALPGRGRDRLLGYPDPPVGDEMIVRERRILAEIRAEVLGSRR